MFLSAHSGPSTTLGVESDMASVFMELINYVGVFLLGDRVKWNVLIHSRGQSILEEPWEKERG